MLHFLAVPAVTLAILAADTTNPAPILGRPEASHPGWSSEKLFGMCTSIRNDDYAMCIGYLWGVSDKISLSRLSKQKSVCIAPDAGSTELRDIYVAFLHAHPAMKARYPAAAIASAAILEKWCPEDVTIKEGTPVPRSTSSLLMKPKN
jgi:hypothetical protein